MTDRSDGAGLSILLCARIVLLILLSLMLAGVAILSFQRNFGYDTAQMLWYGRLIGQLHYVPYRDIFEENLPGAILAYTAIGALIDYSNRFLLRFFDLVYLTAIALATWRWLRPLGRQVAWAAVVLFSVFYLLGGPGFSTQREYIFLLPVVSALAVSTSAVPIPDARRALLVGLLFGIATTIKPHAAIGLLPVFVFHYFETRARQSGARPSLGQVVRALAAYALGGVIPIIAIVIFLALSGGLGPWLDIVLNYWPLYATTTGDITVLTGLDRLRFIIGALGSFGGQAPWLIPAAVGAAITLWRGALSTGLRRRVWLMIGLVVGYTLYPALTGQFYPQHWLPMTYFVLAAGALCFVRPPENHARWLAAAVPFVAVLAALILRGDVLAGGFNQMVDAAVYHKPPPSIDGDRGAEIAGYLESHLNPGDTVQSLDPVGYTMHGMLLSGATPATRFQADAPFYTQPGAPYIKGLRAELIGAMREAPPRYVVDVVARARLRSDNNVPPFSELDDLLRTAYTPAYLGHGFLIYERVTGARPGLIVYPSEYSGASPADLAPFKDDLLTFASGRPAANLGALGRRLDALLETHDHIYFENLGEESDSAQAIEMWLNQSAYRVAEQRIASTRLIEYLSSRVVCPRGAPVSFHFGYEIDLHSVSASLVEVSGQRYACVRLRLSARRTPPRAYALSVHIVDKDGSPVAEYINEPVGNLLPTTSWMPNQAVDDQFALRLPDQLPPGDYRAMLYIYDVETHNILLLGADGSNVLWFGKMHLP